MEERVYKRGWKAKIERGATYESLEWQEEWDAMPVWEKALICLAALLMPFIGSIV